MKDAFLATLSDADLDPSLRAYSLSLPDFSVLEQETTLTLHPHPNPKPKP